MRRLSIAAGTLAALAFSCVDLFHDTDVGLAARVDASTPEVSTDAPNASADAAPLDFCSLDPSDAKKRAHRACALLAACQTPFGRNATGACLERALPAIGCALAPGRVVRGAALEFYRCLVSASTCDDVARCVFKSPTVPVCGSGGITQCRPAIGAPAVRADCPTAAVDAVGEPCSDLGQICSGEGDYLGVCTGKGGHDNCEKTRGCDGTFVVRCNRDGGDDGYDCSLFGAGACAEADAGGACVPNGGGCTPGPVVCDSQGLVTGCVGNKQDRISCALFEGSCHDAGALAALDAVEACRVRGDAGCEVDRCNGADGPLTACVLGNRITIDCKALVGTGCREYVTGDGTRSACARP